MRSAGAPVRGRRLFFSRSLLAASTLRPGIGIASRCRIRGAPVLMVSVAVMIGRAGMIVVRRKVRRAESISRIAGMTPRGVKVPHVENISRIQGMLARRVIVRALKVRRAATGRGAIVHGQVRVGMIVLARKVPPAVNTSRTAGMISRAVNGLRPIAVSASRILARRPPLGQNLIRNLSGRNLSRRSPSARSRSPVHSLKEP